MKYSVLRTTSDTHIGYVNHRSEFVSVSICYDYETAIKQANLLNAGVVKQDQHKQSGGNRYMRRLTR